MDFIRLAAGAAVALSLGSAAGATIIVRNAPSVRTRAETCTLLAAVGRAPDPYADAKSPAGLQARKASAALAKRAHDEVCVRRKGEPDPPVADDGSQHFGRMVDGKPEGLGVRFYGDGSRYIGEWKAGVRQGEGMGLQADGARYVGHFDDDKPHGKGVLQYHAKIDAKVTPPGKKP